MSQHKSTVSFQHMLDNALEAVAMTKGKKRTNLELNLAGRLMMIQDFKVQ